MVRAALASTVNPLEKAGPAPCQSHSTVVGTEIGPDVQLLTLAYPEFTIGQSERGRNGPAWAAIRKDPAQPGLYAIVTPDLDELREVLARHTDQHSGTSYLANRAD
jgi:hypothetical protein